MSNVLHFPSGLAAMTDETSRPGNRAHVSRVSAIAAKSCNEELAGTKLNLVDPPVPYAPASRRAAPARTSESTPTSMKEKTRRMVAIMAKRGRAARKPDDPLPDAAEVIAVAMRWVSRRGRRLDCLPPTVRADLDALCAAGDPSAVLVRDWIDCKLPTSIAEALSNAGRA